MKLQDKRVFVTGADGFIGSHVVEALVRAGVAVRAMVFYNSFDSWGWLDHAAPDVRGQFEVVAGDVRDPNGVSAAMRSCDVIMHLAALIGIPYSYDAPASYVETNTIGTLNIVQSAREHEAERVIVTSTSEVYGTARFVPITEEHPLQGQSPYSASKIGADAIALSYQKSFGTPVAILRPFNTYGPRQSARAVIPTVIEQIASGKRTLELGSLAPTRDFTFVEDTAEGFLAAAGCDDMVGEVVNIGSNFEVSIGDTARVIAELMNCSVQIVTDEKRVRPPKSEVERLLASTEKAERLFAWRPAHGGFEGFRRGLARTIDWFRDPANMARYKSDRYVK